MKPYLHQISIIFSLRLHHMDYMQKNAAARSATRNIIGNRTAALPPAAERVCTLTGVGEAVALPLSDGAPVTILQPAVLQT